ncbi:MAG: hypothetical protein JWN48_4661 [Myxococcaceae bacterium]|nr:hypothetical protein [Myxococcaceae bacterium]
MDPTSYGSVADDVGRQRSIVQRMEVGSADPIVPEHYNARSWETRKFNNPTVRAVNDFDPARDGGLGNDYNPPDSMTTGRERLLIWGRPAFAGARAVDRSARLYFAYVDLPNRSDRGDFAWSPQYYTGSLRGVPQFSSNQALATPLNLNGLADGFRTDDVEALDLVNQASIIFVAGLGRWVMLYGGGAPAGAEYVFPGGDTSSFSADGAIVMRWTLSDAPWGPWSSPQRVLTAGDRRTSPPAPGSQYGPGGILHHPDCNQADCAPYEFWWGDGTYGALYGVNIVEPWTEDRSAAVDLYWNVSTWNPYQVVLMRTRLRK